jgi:uncharacterized protein YllA (UPF0747 family)
MRSPWSRSRGRRAALAALLAADLPADDAAAGAALARLASPGTVAVVCGQQPAFGGGPLYSLVKAAQAIALADRLGQAGRRAVAVFWCASEDHDLGEADHADLISRHGAVARVRAPYADQAAGHPSLRYRSAALHYRELLAACERHLGSGPGAPFLAAAAPTPDEPLGAWTARLLRRLFAGRGLLVVESYRLRPLWTAAIPATLDQWPAELLARRRAHLLAAGHADAFGSLEAPPWFLDDATGRRPLTVAAVRAQLSRDPLLLSPGAALRPVLQQAALPAAIYVAGPGEMAYHAFIAPLYAALSQPRPQLVPRWSCTLAPAWFRRQLARWGAAPERLLEAAPPERPALAAGVVDGLAAALRSAQRAADRWAAGDGLERTAAQALNAALVRQAHELERLERRLARLQRQRDQLQPWGELRHWVRPRGQPQDRVMSLTQAIWDWGPGIAGLLIAGAARTPPGGHAWCGDASAEPGEDLAADRALQPAAGMRPA